MDQYSSAWSCCYSRRASPVSNLRTARHSIDLCHASCQGFGLKGELVTTPVTDWSFTDKIKQIKIQTQTPYLLPLSVTIWCGVYNGNLYVSSNPGKLWNDDVVRDPHVRLKIGDKLYDRTLLPISDPAEKEAVLEAKEKKYAGWKAPPVSKSTVYRVMPG